MLARYEDATIAHLFRPEAVYDRWIEVELAVLEAQAAAGLVPEADFRAIWEAAQGWIGDADKGLLPPFISQEEHLTHHDVVAFVNVMIRLLGSPADRWWHFGLTSSDVVDTALAMALNQAMRYVGNLGQELATSLGPMVSSEFLNTPQEARTHLQVAAPLLFGDRTTRWNALVQDAVASVRSTPVPGKVSGPIGTGSRWLPLSVQTAALRSLGVPRAGVTGQCVPRSFHARALAALAELATACEQVALDLRLLSATRISEVVLRSGISGSSAMPHKAGLNPVALEKVCGLAHLVRSYARTLQDVSVTFLEHSLEHSSVERVVIPDALHATAHLVQTLTDVVDTLQPVSSVTAETPDSYASLCYAIEGGLTRAEAIRQYSLGL